LRYQGSYWYISTTLNSVIKSYSKDWTPDCLFYCLENDCHIHAKTLYELYNSQKNKDIITNLLLRKVILHPRIKNMIIEGNINPFKKYQTLIKDYEEYTNTIYEFIESNTNLHTDVIKYEIIKYI
jgi:hypothetical protein